MIYSHDETLAQMREADQTRKNFAAAYQRSPSGRHHEARRAEVTAAYESRMNGCAAAQTQLAAEIQKNAPGIPLDSAHVLAARRLGILQ